MLIVKLVNKITYFNKEIKHFIWILAWTQELFTYYNRYYRYLRNEKVFGKQFFKL